MCVIANAGVSGDYLQRRPGAARLVGAGRNPARHPRTRRQRHAAWHRPRHHPQKNLDDDDLAGCSSARSRCFSPACAPRSNLGAGLSGGLRRDLSRRSPRNTAFRSTRSSSTASPAIAHLQLEDGMHPNPAGHVDRMVERMLPTSREAATRGASGRRLKDARRG